MAKQTNNNGANLGFEAHLRAAADKLRGNMEASDYKHVALGLIFLRYISDAFEGKRADPLFEIVSTNIHESRTLAQTRDLLLPKLMSGGIRLAEAEKGLEAVA